MGNTAAIPPPPPGFAPIQSAPSPPPGGDGTPPPPPGFAPIQSAPAGDATPPSHWYDAAAHELGELNTGFTTGLSQTGLTAQKVIGAIPGVGPAFTRATATARAADEARAAQPMNTGGRIAGNAIENIIEFAAGDEALKGASMLTRVKQLAPLASTLEKLPPKLLDIMANGVRQGAVSGGQTLLHGGTGKEAAINAAVGAGTSAALEGVAAKFGKTAAEVAPKVRSIGGEEIPTLASQDVDAPKSAIAAADIDSEPQYQKAQQAGAQRVIGKSAQRATRVALEDLNQGRNIPLDQPALPAPADAKPYQFTMRTAGDVTPTGEGQIAFEPGKQQIGTRAVEGKGPGKFDLPQYSPELADAASDSAAGEGTLGATNPQPEPQGSHREPIYQYRNAPKPGTEGNVVTDTPMGGGGTITTSDPNIVRRNLTNLEQMMDLDSFGDLSPQRQGAIQDEAQSLRKQLDDYGAYRAISPHFAPIDIGQATQGIRNYGQAGDQIIEQAQPTFQKLDEVSDGEFSALRSQQKAALKVIKNPGTDTAYDNAVARLDKINGQINDIFNANKEQIAPQEWTQAKKAYRDGMTLNELHAEIERSYRGAPEAAVARNPTELTRRLQGGEQMNRGIDRVMQKRGDTVTRLIGQDGVDNLYRVSALLNNGESSDATKSLLGSIGTVARRHIRGLAGLSATAGIGAAAHLLGIPHAFGVATAATAAEGANLWALHNIATNPDLARSVEFAVKNHVVSRTAAPLLGWAMIRAEQDNKPQEK